MSGDSTIFQLLTIYNDFCRTIDEQSTAQAIFFDISKAFDKVWHKGLLEKLSAIGVKDPLLKWFRNYLSGRTQAVTIKGSSSQYLPIFAGVPRLEVINYL